MTQQPQEVDKTQFEERRQLYERVVEAFGEKYSWLGAQASRELLMSAASWNIQRYSNPHIRYRTHTMLAWERGWVKSTLLREMADILGEDMTSTIGKVTDAAMRGSVSAGQFMPPKPLKAPIVISTEFGQTDFQDELLNILLALLEEGRSNISLNKIGRLPDSAKDNIQNQYPDQVEFTAENEFELTTDFVFWGATYDPTKLQDDALRSRLNIVTPAKPLTSEITKRADKKPSVKTLLDKSTVRDLRNELGSEKEVRTRFIPTDHIYNDYKLNFRESRDIQSRMAARNWWGLEVNPEVMEKYISYLKKSRQKAMMNPKERVFELVFDNPMTYEEIQDKTGYTKKQIYKIIQSLDAKQAPTESGEPGFAVYSGDETLSSKLDEDGEDTTPSGLESLLKNK